MHAAGDIMIAGPLILTLRIFLVGIALSWFMPPLNPSQRPPWMHWLITSARAALTGTLISALLALILGQAGCYQPAIEAALLTGISIAGVAPGLGRHRQRLYRHVRLCLPGAAISLIGITVIMALPGRDEWILGGWDPGVYISEGVALERTGTFHLDDPLLFDALTEPEAAVFTRGDERRTERFPGVVIDTKHQRLSYQFFRLHPALLAVFARDGGLQMALRGNTILGMFSLFIFLAMLLQFADLPLALSASLLLAAQPLWLYHAHTPVSEMLQLLLLFGVGLLLPHRNHSLVTITAIAMLMLAMVLNRFSFLPFASLMVVLIAWADLPRDDRRRVWRERSLLWLALVAAAWIDASIAPTSLHGWSTSVLPIMIAVACACAVLATTLDLMGGLARIRQHFAPTPRWLRLLCTWSCLAALAALWGRGIWGAQTADADNLKRLVPYLGIGTVACACIGIIVLTHFRHRQPTRRFGSFLLALFGILLVVLFKKWAQDFYPWATRRYLVNAVPLTVILAAVPVAALWQSKTRTTLCRVLAATLLLGMLAGNAKRSWHAWSREESHGAVSVLNRIAEQIDPRDIVIVDTPTWGMPLNLIAGKDVLNGKHMWRRKDPEQMQVGLQALQRLAAQGRRIRFLTTTRTLGLDIYPAPVEPASLDWESEEIALERINHSEHADDIDVNAGRNIFRLYTWNPL